ncbi:MAG: phosphoribosylamine--glycine ligase [Bacteroidetes bacterium GWF2_43_63]|nr:MAG: phosphoribosylamine--glycine ligase [Bacteroidetes bacterium GWE2_42_42]OFY52979.1 MAG: phosphoribosylamine--glycine ligase [Bacteroidetes bacterium GWF2_43_63]HBG70190.1 phosphoribosylamine--glycine ligase [Bacteroidales bacterium]HCB62202.1 phosphoribosylamine--glycine ligase [Bacteroidales bacterium]
MKILITGSGGREHALAWRLARDIGKENIFIAPGNAGTLQCGTNLPYSFNDFENLLEQIISLSIDMILVGPEEPLVNGFTDLLKKDPRFINLLIVGPSAHGAMLEGSKDFAKQFMIRHDIPTAAYATFTSEQKTEAQSYIRSHSGPYVMKADGLAAGKGVVITESADEAVNHIASVFEDNIFGEAGKTLVIEQFLDGIEMSVFALTDGKNYVLLPGAKDYKRIGDGNTGPNTGGMGTVSPVPFATKEFMDKVVTRVVEPTISGFQKDNIDYCGFVFFGLMNVNGDPFVIEYNVRMGDPETQVVMPRIGGSFAEMLTAAATGNLKDYKTETLPMTALSIVLASKGYPGDYEKGKTISLPEGNHLIFHAGTKVLHDNVVTSGGRVMAVVGTGNTLDEARTAAYNLADHVHFEGKTNRSDIGLDLKAYEIV